MDRPFRDLRRIHLVTLNDPEAPDLAHIKSPCYNPQNKVLYCTGTSQVNQDMNRAIRMQINDPRIDSDVLADSRLEPPFTVFIHNDDVTPFEYVILILSTIFELSHELAEHITWVAHNTGTARVVTRPRSEAERLVSKAHAAARMEGFPLTFSMEPDE